MTALLVAEQVSKAFATRVRWRPEEAGPLRRLLTQRRADVLAVDDVSLTINAGETLGLVGESGCGKSTLGRLLLGLLPLTAGRVMFRGQPLPPEAEMRPVRRQMQLIFQDPYASLSPRMRVRDIIAEPFIIHELDAELPSLTDRVHALLALVGLPAEAAAKYPHEFSGGQRQRIGIARALALNPALLVCDEPISALDVSIQAQIVNLLVDLQADKHLTYLFISHDLRVVQHISDRIAVMYLGRIVELGPASVVTHDAQHPYTKALLSAIPTVRRPQDKTRARIVLQGDVPSPLNAPAGCGFYSRCPDDRKDQSCEAERPVLRVLSNGCAVACHKAT